VGSLREPTRCFGRADGYFQETPDLTAIQSSLPAIAADNLMTQKPEDKARRVEKKSNRQNFAHADMPTQKF